MLVGKQNRDDISNTKLEGAQRNWRSTL